MEIFQLTYAEALAQYRNFSRAAEKLFITQPALSQQIQKLEQELGFALFKRNSKSVELTLAGKQFLADAQDVISSYNRLRKTAQTISGSMTTEITFGSSPLSAPHISDGLSAFFSEYPGINFRYIETWDPVLLELIAQGEIDIALLCLPHGNNQLDDYVVWPIRDEYTCVVVSKRHPLATRTSVTLDDLVTERMVFTSPNSGLRALMVDMLENCNIQTDRIIDLISIEARLSLVRNGAVTFVMNEQFQIYQTSEFSVIPIEPKIYRTFALVSSKGKSNLFAVQAFVDTTLQKVDNRLSAYANT